jgi:GNAT superfamily N-acetyltransferase
MNDIVIAGCDAGTARQFADAHWRGAAKDELGAPFVWTFRPFAFSAHLDGEMVGVLALSCVAGVARVEELIVAAPRRRGGIGSALLARAEDAASYQNCHKMIAAVKQGGSGQTFLESHRYRVAATLPRHYFQIDFVEMVRWLW